MSRPARLLLSLALAVVFAPGCVILSEDDIAARKDVDGDGVTLDEDCDDADPSVGAPRTFSVDSDGDGFAGEREVEACRPPAGATDQGGDCDDDNPLVFPGAPDAPYDGLDADCLGDDVDGDGVLDDYDQDGDGEAAAPEGADCDDSDPAIFSGADELCDGVDNDCDGLLDVDDPDLDPAAYATAYPDLDGDGFGDEALGEAVCTPPAGWVSVGGDCDDGQAAVNPEATELCNLGVDDDCDGLIDAGDPDVDFDSAPDWYEDGDRDGYGDGPSLGASCSAPAADTAPRDGDCDDGLPGVNPGVREVCDALDNDCDGLTDDSDPSLDPASRSRFFRDADSDGYGDPATAADSCDQPGGWVPNADDCDDALPYVNPAAREVCNGGLDDDCDGLADDADPGVDSRTFTVVYADLDGDTYGDPAAARGACAPSSAEAARPGDCDDSQSSTNPGALEVCDDGVDNDCDDQAAPCGRGTFGLTSGAVSFDGDGSAAAGAALSFVPDNDGDGGAELWIGAPDADLPFPSGGAAYLALSGDSGSLSSVAGSTVGMASSSTFGASISGGLDFNGDGYPDVAIGAPGYDSGGALNAGGAVVLDATTGGTNVSLLGSSGRSALGTHLLMFPDLNGDGRAELAASGPTDSSGADRGQVYFVFGGTASGALDASGRRRVVGEQTGDRLGNRAGGRGLGALDFDGDGLPDVVIGATEAGDVYAPGRAYLFLGDDLLAIGSTSSAADASLIVYGSTSARDLGAAVRGLGDLDGDGFDDLGVSASSSEVALVFSGTSRVPSSTVPTDAHLRLTGGSGAAFGADLAGGDIDGDGSGDLVVGAPDDDSGAPDGGLVVGWFGPLPSGTLTADAAPLRILGDASSERLGTLLDLGDVDGDGDLDIASGAARALGGSGRVWIWSAEGL
jgi:hypothetical protein